MAKKPVRKKSCTYSDDDLDYREGEVVQKNGNLTLVRDSETGEESYRSPHEIRDTW